ncbi:MAG: RluA family pseudouridine synthase [Clostridiales bacterium]|nr:RluA family pseudouridine synthase [Clostridiales bacterium]
MSRQFEYEVEQAGHRLDLLVAECTGNSRAEAQRLIEGGGVLVNGRRRPKNHRVAEGDLLSISLPDQIALEVLPEDIPLDILYEDDSLLVVDKPRGMVVHPAAGNPGGTLVNALLFHCGGALSGVGGAERPGIVHRIDKDTSGLLMVAKTDEVHHALSAQLQLHSIDREYEAVVHGCPRQDEGRVEAPVGRNAIARKEMAVVPDGKPALTAYRVLARGGSFSHLRCRLSTGRTHQIRVHMAHIGHPVAGDPVYGPRRPALEGGQCLHAALLAFTHPVTGGRMRFESPLPPYFTAFLARVGLAGTEELSER